MAFTGSTTNSVKLSQSHRSCGTTGCTDDHCKNGQRMPTIFDAIKAGMLLPVQTLVETSGVGILSSRDDKGHTPAHWAALGGHATILRYILELKAPVDEPSHNELRQHPIHWACVNGHIAIVEILLQVGVDIDVPDNKGCTPLIVACQYGQTMLAGYLMGKGARTQAVDKDGDTALHWAAFKGHSELMRLLVYSGFNPHQRDNYGQTPLHLSCINGNLTAVRELCEQDQVEIDIPDKNGKTPLMLAVGRKHEKVIQFLKKESRSRTSLIPKIDIWAIIFGPPGNTKGPLLFFIVNLLCWAYPVYLIKCLPVTWYELQPLHMIFMFSNVVMWISLYHASTSDPGFLPRNVPEYDQAIKEVAHFDEWKHGRNPLGRLCHTCRTVKPMRSKHCRICGRCVRMMDHHCPYIYNCVGVRNRVWFFAFVSCVWFNCLTSIYLCLFLLRTLGWDWLIFLGGCQIGFFTVISTLVFTFTVSKRDGNAGKEGLVVLGKDGIYPDTCSESLKRVSFLLFAASTMTSGFLSIYIALFTWSMEEWRWQLTLALGVLELAIFQFISTTVTVSTVYHACVNLTTNERINQRRYKYLQDGKGKYHNPYNRGWKNNLLEFCYLKKGLNEDEVEFLNVTVI